MRCRKKSRASASVAFVLILTLLRSNFYGARLNTYLAFSEEGLDEERLDCASAFIDKAIAEGPIYSSQQEMASMQEWKKQIEDAFALLVPVDGALVRQNALYTEADKPAEPAHSNQAFGYDGTDGTAAEPSYYFSLPLPLCGDRACRATACQPPAAPTPAAEAEHPYTPVSSHAHGHSRSSSHAHSHSSHESADGSSASDKAAAQAEARDKAMASIAQKKKEALANASDAGKKAIAEAQQRAEDKKATQLLHKAVPKSQRRKFQNSRYASGSFSTAARTLKALPTRSKIAEGTVPRGSIADALASFARKEAEDKAQEDQDKEDEERGMEG